MEFAIEVLATDGSFNEQGYLKSNPDVADAVKNGMFSSGYHHFDLFGRGEARKVHDLEGSFMRSKKDKLSRVRDILRKDLPVVEFENSFDFLSEGLREQFNIIDTDAVSSNQYDGTVLSLIKELDSGLILDCGAGKRTSYYHNVVNFEIADYASTDVRGVGEVLPFIDDSFDAVISIAVLEHVKDPFRCAKEISRVLKPGGKLICCVPFLQPLHGYPHHYYNMSGQGLENLFSEYLTIDSLEVSQSMLPIWCLTWFLKSWSDGLASNTREDFLNMRIGDFIGPASDHLKQPYVMCLSAEKNMELACATIISAHK